MSVLYCYLSVFYIVGGRTQYHEDPIEGGTTFRRVDMQKFRSICGAQVETDRERMKNGGRQKQKCNMGSSPLFIGVNNYLLAEFSQPLTCKQPQTISTVSGTAFEDLPGKRETTFISFESRS